MSGGSLYSEVHIEQVLSCLGEDLYTVRSKLNEFYHVWGRGLYTVRSKLNEFYHVWGRVSIQ